MNQIQFKMDSPLGALYIVANPQFLKGIYWKKQNIPMGVNPIIELTQKELTEYFAGERKEFSIPLEAQGTEFQKQVWKQLSLIPYGKTVSYSQVAQRVKNPKAVRAVGTANGRNPLSIIVPCHRVIAANGTLGGYAGGLGIKEKLLKLESGV